MKLSITLISFLLFNISYGQELMDRYEAVYYELHALEEFDLKGNVQQVITEHFELKDPEAKEITPAFIGKRELNFNKDGLLTSSFEIRTTGDTFDYKYFTYNLQKQLTKVQSKNLFFAYAYDDAGNLITMEYNKGMIMYTRKFTYDGLNRMLSDQMFSEADPVFTDQYTYADKTNQIVTCVTTDHPNKNFDETTATSTKTYAYHQNGVLKSISKVHNTWGTTEYNYLRTFNEAGDLLTYIMGDPDLDPSCTNEVYTYDSAGNSSTFHAYYVFAGEGDMIIENRAIYTFDATKNWIEYTIMGAMSWSLDSKSELSADTPRRATSKEKRTITYYKA